MHLLDLTLDDPLANLALDEALLAAAEAGQLPGPVLRLWESPRTFVVLGRSSKAEVEVHLRACRQGQVPVFRRASGGGTVVSGPGCLCYAVVLDYEQFPHLRAVDAAHRYVLGRLAACLAPLVPGITPAGTSDLAIPASSGRLEKCSGNALRMKRTHFLYHGTLLYDFALPRIDELLGDATRTPDYREGRSHTQFVRNLPLAREEIVQALCRGWQADSVLVDWPQAQTFDLVREKRQAGSLWVLC